MTFLLPGSAPARSAVVNTAKGTVKTVAAATTKTVDTLSGLPTIFKGSEGSLGRIRSNEVGAVGDLDNLPPAALGTYTDDFSVAAVPDAVTPSSINVQLDQPATATRQVGPVVIEEFPTQPLPENMRNAGSVSVKVDAPVTRNLDNTLEGVGDVYDPNFVGPVQWEYFYRGHSAPGKEFNSAYAEYKGVDEAFRYVDELENTSRIDAYRAHAVSSQTSPYVSVTSQKPVAEHFARGVNQDQAGYVTKFRFDARDPNKPQFNYENKYNTEEYNPALGRTEAEYLAKVRIDPKHVVEQYRVATNNVEMTRSEMLHQKYGHLSSVERRELISRKAEANAEKWVRNFENQLDSSYPNLHPHFVEKHGPDIPLSPNLRQRSIDGSHPRTGYRNARSRPQESSQFNNWLTQRNILNEAITRETRGLPKYNAIDSQGNPAVKGSYPGGAGRGYTPNRSNLPSPSYNSVLDNWIIRFDPTTGQPFTGYPMR